MKIPKIIHQIWSGVDEPLPDHLKELGRTWQEHHPDWEYVVWNNAMMVDFIQDNYHQYIETYNSFQYNVQRWDAIRYLILDKIGGMYTDFDSECLLSHNELLRGKECCFSIEPYEHGVVFGKELYFNNALMASVPEHPFMKGIIEKVFSYVPKEGELPWGKKIMEVLTTTGPLTLVNLYEDYADKESIYLIPAKYTSPLTKDEVQSIMRGNESDELEQKLEDAYSIHYFFNGWVNN